VPPLRAETPGDTAGGQVEESGCPQPSGSAAAPAWHEEDALALVAQMERDEEMARTLAAEDSALARQLQVPDFNLIEHNYTVAEAVQAGPGWLSGLHHADCIGFLALLSTYARAIVDNARAHWHHSRSRAPHIDARHALHCRRSRTTSAWRARWPAGAVA
jgi:hypothetical protein